MTAPAVYLASKSPRREELLRQLGVEFDVAAPARSARSASATSSKARATPSLRFTTSSASRAPRRPIGWQRMLQRGLPPRPVLGADTEVVLDDAIFGKPKDAADAVAHARRASSGRTHQVLTAVAMCWEENTVAEISTSTVTFRAHRSRRDRALRRHRRAVRQGRRVRDPGPRRDVRAADRRQLFRRHGPAALRDRPTALAGIGFPVL